MKRLPALAATLVLTVALAFGGAVPATAATSTERRMLANINDAREDRDLPPLELDRRLSRAARRAAERMEREGRLEHSADLSTAFGRGRFAENIGWVRERGLSERLLAGRLHRGFLRSTRHRRNVLGDFDRIGIGIVVSDDETMWMSVIFSG